VTKKTNFDVYLKQQMKDPDFAERFGQAGAAWDIALQPAELRKKAGLSQKELARRLHTTQQQISRLESPSYEGHSLSMLRRVDHVVNAKIRVTFELASSRQRTTTSKEKWGHRELFWNNSRCPHFSS
jgi:DNA-binding XRE family transcriptional regulator